MTASVLQKGKWAKFATQFGTAALAATLCASVVAGSVAPAQANDFYYDEQFDNDQFVDQQDVVVSSSRRIYRDETGRYFIRHGRKRYIQYFDRDVYREPVVTPRRHRDRDKNLETAIIAGVAGLAIGAIIAGSNQQPERVVVQPKPRRLLPRDTFPDRPTSYEPRVVTYEGAFEPWSQSWADWCSQRYRSFKISNGTYTGYDGVSRFCVVK